MPSYKIYQINKIIDLKNQFSTGWINKVKPIKGDIEVLNQKINNTKKVIKDETIKNNEKLAKNAYTIDYMYNYQVDKAQKVWISDFINIISTNSYLFVSKGKSRLRLLIQTHLESKISLLDVNFNPKKLRQLWNKIKKLLNIDNHDVSIHRLILEKSFIDADNLKEINISANNVENLGIFSSLLKNSERIRVITIKIKWNPEEEVRLKNMVIRINSSGSFLIYGDHPKQSIDKFFEYFTKSLSSL